MVPGRSRALRVGSSPLASASSPYTRRPPRCGVSSAATGGGPLWASALPVGPDWHPASVPASRAMPVAAARARAIPRGLTCPPLPSPPTVVSTRVGRENPAVTVVHLVGEEPALALPAAASRAAPPR